MKEEYSESLCGVVLNWENKVENFEVGLLILLVLTWGFDLVRFLII